MTKMNIIPSKIPFQIWEKKQYDDIILYALGAYGAMKREEFINNSEKGISNRMNKNTFHKWTKKLKSKNYINVSRAKKKSVYTITNLGVNKLVNRLESYTLNLKNILNLEQKALSKEITQITQFFNVYDITNTDIMIEFLKLKNEIIRDKLKYFSEDKLNKSILYLTLNHPKFYHEYGGMIISINDFIIKYSENNLTKIELKWFLHKVIEQKACNISFYELKLSNKDLNLYFRSTEEYGIIFKSTIQSILRDLYYLGNLFFNDFKGIIINDLCEEILDELINRYHLFHKDLEIPLYNLIKSYLISLFKDLKRKKFINPIDLKEIPTLILTSEIFVFERLDYLQKMSLLSLEEANDMLSPLKYREKIRFALEYIEKAILLNNKNSLNYSIKAQILHFVGKYEEALRAIIRAIKLNPKVADYYSNMANILIWMSRYEKALVVINKAIKLEPKNPDYYSDLASIFSFLDRYEKALEALNIAIKLDPKRIQFYIQKSSYLAYDMKKYKIALKVIQKAIELNPKKLPLFEPYKQQAGILLCMKNRETAINVIKKVKRLFPNKEIYPNLC